MQCTCPVKNPNKSYLKSALQSHGSGRSTCNSSTKPNHSVKWFSSQTLPNPKREARDYSSSCVLCRKGSVGRPIVKSCINISSLGPSPSPANRSESIRDYSVPSLPAPCFLCPGYPSSSGGHRQSRGSRRGDRVESAVPLNRCCRPYLVTDCANSAGGVERCRSRSRSANNSNRSRSVSSSGGLADNVTP